MQSQGQGWNNFNFTLKFLICALTPTELVVAFFIFLLFCLLDEGLEVALASGGAAQSEAAGSRGVLAFL